MAFEVRVDAERSWLGLTHGASEHRPRGQLDHLVDTTMLFAPRSGGVKRYLLAKRAWLANHHPDLRHSLVVPGPSTRDHGRGLSSVAAVKLPFADGYRWPTSTRRWTEALLSLDPSLIEAGDPYGPGLAALDAGERLGVPVVGFCHTDPAALAALHLGSWAEPPVRRRWARIFTRFDRVVAPSRHIAERLDSAGVGGVLVQPLGVDTDLFKPQRGDPAALRQSLGISAKARLLVFAGRPAREKNVDVLLEAAATLGPPYHLLLIGAGAGARAQANASFVDFQRDPGEVARMLAGCDVFVHANPNEPFGLAALEALACGLPVVGVSSGGVAEIVDDQIGRLVSGPNPRALAEAIEDLFGGDLAAVSARARRRAALQHGWDATFTRLMNLYAELTGAPGPAPGEDPWRTTARPS